MLKRVGESRHPCRTPTVVRNQPPTLLLKRTALVAFVVEVFEDLADKVGADVLCFCSCRYGLLSHTALIVFTRPETFK